MSFTPYHSFANQTQLERLVETLNNTGNITDSTAYENFNRYHPAMIHKLKSAKYNLDRLTDKLTTTDIQDVVSSTGDFMFEVNMYIDGFFYNAGSAMDILARVVLTLFGEPLSGKVYFQTAEAKISTARPNDPILPKLSTPPWRDTFTNYRNTLTHELIVASICQITLSMSGVSQQDSHIILPLPDDPRATPSARTYRQNPNALDYLSQQFRRVLRLVNQVYGHIFDRATTARSLPI